LIFHNNLVNALDQHKNIALVLASNREMQRCSIVRGRARTHPRRLAELAKKTGHVGDFSDQ
jgi:hypothetical protein